MMLLIESSISRRGVEGMHRRDIAAAPAWNIRVGLAVAAAVVPERQVLAAAERADPPAGENCAQPQQFTPAMRADLAPGRGHRFAQDDDPPLPREAAAERQLLGREERLVEAARRVERGARAEDVAACRE